MRHETESAKGDKGKQNVINESINEVKGWFWPELPNDGKLVTVKVISKNEFYRILGLE